MKATTKQLMAELFALLNPDDESAGQLTARAELCAAAALLALHLGRLPHLAQRAADALAALAADDVRQVIEQLESPAVLASTPAELEGRRVALAELLAHPLVAAELARAAEPAGSPLLVPIWLRAGSTIGLDATAPRHDGGTDLRQTSSSGAGCHQHPAASASHSAVTHGST